MPALFMLEPVFCGSTVRVIEKSYIKVARGPWQILVVFVCSNAVQDKVLKEGFVVGRTSPVITLHQMNPISERSRMMTSQIKRKEIIKS